MKRILLMVFRNIILVPVMWSKLCYYASHVDKYTEEQRYAMLKFIVLRANKGGNVTIDVHGRENIPDKDGFMFFLTIRDYMMSLLYWKPVPGHFRLWPRKKLPISSS